MTITDTDILSKTINLKDALKTYPELFNFTKLSISDKSSLLNCDFEFYAGRLDLVNLPAREKLSILCELKKPTASVLKKFKLTDKELAKLTDSEYVSLLKVSFEDHFSLEKYNALSRECQAVIFLMYPKRMLEITGTMACLSRQQLSLFILRYHKLTFKYINEIIKMKSNADIWIRLIRHDVSLMDQFLSNTHLLATNTDVREVFYVYPKLVKLVTPEIILNSKLTPKEWILLINRVIGNNSSINGKLFGFELSADMKEFFDQTASIITLQGNGSIALTKAAKTLRAELPKSIEDTSLQTFS